MSVYSDDSVGVLIYYDSIRVHTECTDIIFKLLCTVNNLAFIQFICQMRKDYSRKFHTYTDIHTIGLGRNIQILADCFHPFASASSYRNDTFLTFVGFFFCDHFISIIQNLQLLHWCIKIKVHMVFHCIVHIFQNNVVDVCSQMTYRCIQKIQLVLKAEFLEFGSCCGIKFGSFSTVFHVNVIYIFHQVNGFFFADMLIQSTTKIIGDIIFSIRKCSCATETAHNRTSLTVDACFYLFSINWTFSLFKRISLFKNCHLAVRFLFH